MKRLRKSLSILLLCAMLTTAACSGASDTAPETTTGDTTPEVTAEPSEYRKPDVNYGGKTIYIATYENEKSPWQISRYHVALDEENGDVINDALVAARRAAEEALGVKIDIYSLSSADIDSASRLTAPIMAGDEDYHIGMIFTKLMPQLLSTPSLLVDLAGIDTLDLSHTWWNQASLAEYNISGKQLAAVGDACFFNTTAGVVTYVNKQLVEDFSLEDPYELVKSGKWTIDKMAEMCETVSNDLNGNSEIDEADRFGLLAEDGSLPYFVTAAGVRFSEKSGNEIDITLNSERTVDIVEKTVTLFNKKEQSMLAHQYSKNYSNVFFELFIPKFFRNEALFFSNQLLVALEMRSMEGDFGILPTPKLDEAQENYHSIGSTAWTDNVIVPASVSDPDMIGNVLDALGYYSQQYTTPAIIDVTVRHKSIRDEGSAEMIDIILDSQTFDIAYIFNWGSIRSMLPGLVRSGSTNFVSAYETISASVEAALEKTLTEMEK